MQPRRCRRGEPSCCQVCRVRRALQCSHDVAVVENTALSVVLTREEALQCSHDVAVVENFSWKSVTWTRSTTLQCSHDVAVVENDVGQRNRMETTGASMQPRRCRRGERRLPEGFRHAM